MSDTTDCSGCGALVGAGLRKCEYCGAARPVPERVPQPPEHLSPAEMHAALRASQDGLPEPMPGFWWLHGGIFVLVGLIFTATIIGAIVGIPAILVGLNSWKKGMAAKR